MNFVSPSSGALILEIVFEALDDVATAVGSRFGQIRGLEVVNLNFDLGLHDEYQSEAQNVNMHRTHQLLVYSALLRQSLHELLLEGFVSGPVIWSRKGTLLGHGGVGREWWARAVGGCELLDAFKLHLRVVTAGFGAESRATLRLFGPEGHHLGRVSPYASDYLLNCLLNVLRTTAQQSPAQSREEARDSRPRCHGPNRGSGGHGCNPGRPTRGDMGRHSGGYPQSNHRRNSYKSTAHRQ
jgi:hypothetical protein